jgi:hypothetical protein
MIKELENINNQISFVLVEVTSKKTQKNYKAIAIKFDNNYHIIKFIR